MQWLVRFRCTRLESTVLVTAVEKQHAIEKAWAMTPPLVFEDEWEEVDAVPVIPERKVRQ